MPTTSVPPTLAERARILVVALKRLGAAPYPVQVYALATVAAMASSLVYAPVYRWLLDDPAGALAIALAFPVALASLAAYRVSRNLRLGMQTFSAGIFAVISFLVWHQGGMSSPVAAWLLVVPVAVITAGMTRPALFWFGAAIGEMAVLSALELAGVPMPVQRGRDPELSYMVSQPGLCVLVFVFMLVVNHARRTAFRELGARNAELSAARDEAVEAARVKSRFLANMSHEIRTPLNGVLGTAEVLAGTNLTPEQARLLRMLKESGDTLLALVGDVLDYSKLEAGRLDVETGPVDIRELAGSVADQMAPRALAKHLEFAFRVRPDVPLAIHSDPLRVRQILAKLLGNAIKFTGDGEVVLDVGLAPGPGRWLEFAVADTGIGIGAAERARLFQAFSQADVSTTRTYGGTGLGLAISGELTRLLGGRIEVDSEPGNGSCFRLLLPLGDEAAPRRHPPLATCPTVILAEHHPRTRAFLEEMLQHLGARVLVPGTADQALSYLLTRGGPPPVLLASLPVLEHAGWRECVRLADPADPGAPRLVVTVSEGLPADHFARPHASAILPRPVRETALREALDPPGHGSAVPAAVPEPDTLAGTRVLLVEDNPVNRHIALAMLNRLGCEVRSEPDGEAAVRAWEEAGFDLVLMDCQMPVLDGFDATRQIRAREAVTRRRRTPIVALTANALAGDRELCLGAGMDDHVAKPVTFARLAEVVKRWSGPAPARKAAGE